MRKSEVSFLGVRVHPMTDRDLSKEVEFAIESRRQVIIGHHNLHSVYLVHHDLPMAEFNRRADKLFVDGMGVIAVGRWLGKPLGKRHRVTYVDWIDLLCAEAARRGWRVFHVGGRPGVGDRAANVLVRRHPGLRIDGVAGFFDARPDAIENRAVLEAIDAAEPQVLLVGMGMPRQERWVLENHEEINAHVILTCGSCMDYVAGDVPTPPRWAGSMGLEWLFRLAAEPRRLARRYLVEPWFIAGLAVRERALGRSNCR